MSVSFPRPSASWVVLTAAGLVLASVVALGGRWMESRRFGDNERAAIASVEREVNARVDGSVAALGRMIAQVRRSGDVAGILAGRDGAAPRLFDVLTRAGLSDRGERALTIYGADNSAVAWFGQPSTVPADRLAGAAAVFVAPGSLGLRLVYVEPILAAGGSGQARRVGTFAAERVLSSIADTAPSPQRYTLETSLGRVELFPRFEGAGGVPSRDGFVIPAPDGEPLVEVDVSRTEILAARGRLRETIDAVTLSLVAVTLLVAAAPLVGWRRRARRPGEYLVTFAGLVAAVVAARAIAWWALPEAWTTAAAWTSAGGRLLRLALRSGLDLLLTATAVATVVALLADAVLRARVAARTTRRSPERAVASRLQFLAWQAVAGTAAALVFIAFERLLGWTAAWSGFDVLHLSLHPWEAHRLAVIAGILGFQAASVWLVVLLYRSALIPWRVPRHDVPIVAIMLAGWLAPGVVLTAVTGEWGWGIPEGAVIVGLAVAAAAAWLGARGLGWYRHGSQALRLGALFLALVVPALLAYPSLSYFANRERERLIETQYAAEAMHYPAFLQSRLEAAQQQIDREPDLADRVAAIEPHSPPQTDAAFLIWQRTVLAENRLTSAVELYDSKGQLVSRFALNFPEYASLTPVYRASACAWEVFGEAAPFGAEERRMLHAERGLCDAQGRIQGAIVVHVMPDYDVLPFISSRSPYFEFVRGAGVTEGRPGGDLGLVIYGWGLTTLYTSTGRAWVLDAGLFQRIYRSTRPFWVTLSQGDRRYKIYFTNDRFGIYAVDYRLPAIFDHFVHLAELVTLCAAAFLVMIVLAGLARRLVWRNARPAERLLREIRTSFYRKLFLAFVLASVVPVVILAFLTRNYFAGRLRADVEAEAARTVAVAQRLIEETLALQPGAETGGGQLTDDLLVWVSRVLTQDVTVFAGPQLLATSERDLFASGLLPTRVPDVVYRAIVLQRLPTFVGADQIANVPYLMAAAPLRAAGPDTILTVPLASRQREIEREIDDLDRGVQLGAIVFILLGAGIGFWMAERIGDPVTRLTRASQRIAAGDLDARVFVRSADELQRLVQAFNRMAFELKRQRAQLERTHRLEAWAEMARQVAHDIKNPLTPIQLSAEHLRRVNEDRGQPLGSVLDACVDTILTQVRLLRQIAAEFSSFASTPSPRPVPTDVRELLDEVLRAYSTGLDGRVELSLDVDPDVPSLMVDRTLLGRAVTNVIENALHAMPGGGALAMRAWREPEGVAIAVQDSGVGMDAEALSRIFEPYFSTKAIGTGLGLTIARRNVELHGGSVTVESRKGEGTTVTLRLPLNEVSGAA